MDEAQKPQPHKHTHTQIYRHINKYLYTHTPTHAKCKGHREKKKYYKCNEKTTYSNLKK